MPPPVTTLGEVPVKQGAPGDQPWYVQIVGGGPLGLALDATVSAVRDRLPAALVGGRLDVVVGAALPAGASEVGAVAQGTAAAATAPWYVRLSDGSSAIGVALDATVAAVRDRLPATLGSGGGVLTEIVTSLGDDFTAGLTIQDLYFLMGQIRDRLPGAFTTGGGVKVGLSDSLPAGTATIGKVDQGTGGASAWKVDGSAVTQPVSGTVTANAGTGTFAISAVSLPLPTGAATDATVAAVRDRLPAALGTGGGVKVEAAASPTFAFAANGISIAASGNIAIALTNTGSSVVRVRRVWLRPSQTAAIAGGVCQYAVRRHTGVTAGSAISEFAYDTAVPLAAGIAAVSLPSSVSGAGNDFVRVTLSGDEAAVGAAENEAIQASMGHRPVWEQQYDSAAITLRQNQGLHITCTTFAGATTLVDAVIEITQEST